MTNNREDYLKIIFKLSESGKKVTNKLIASQLGVSPASVSEMVKKLVKDGLVVVHNNMISLTDEAIKYTKDLLSKHRLWETFLLSKLNYTWNDVHEQAERLEHVTDESLKNKLNEFLDYPVHCPHGSIIYENQKEYEDNIIPMGNLKIGDKAKIVKVHSEKNLLAYLDRLNLNINSIFRVVDIDMFDASMIIDFNDSNMVISTKALPAIYVVKI